MVETTEMAIKSMDSQLRNVLSETPEADRGKLISVCLKSIPNRMNFVECVTLVSVLSKMGFVDINNIANDQINFVNYSQDGDPYCIRDTLYSICSASCDFTIDTDGHIKGLYITPDDEHEHDLSAFLAFPERLTGINQYKYRSIPAELSNLPHLEKLHLNIWSLYLLDYFPVQMKLPNLKELVVDMGSVQIASSRFLTWMTTQLPSLEVLEYSTERKNDVTVIIDSLRTSDLCFHNSLKRLTLGCCFMEQESFEILMIEIVPKCRDLKSLNLWYNNIKSFLPIVDSIKNDRTFVPSTSLQVLNIHSNPVFKRMEDDPIEKAALLSFLGTFNTIHNVVGRPGGGLNDSDVEYALRINHAGRRIVVKVDGGSNNDDDGKTIIPLPLWPIILERAYERSSDISHLSSDDKKKKKNATGIYYLLREVSEVLYQRSVDGQ